jgi:hypothetical protein
LVKSRAGSTGDEVTPTGSELSREYSTFCGPTASAAPCAALGTECEPDLAAAWHAASGVASELPAVHGRSCHTGARRAINRRQNAAPAPLKLSARERAEIDTIKEMLRAAVAESQKMVV